MVSLHVKSAVSIVWVTVPALLGKFPGMHLCTSAGKTFLLFMWIVLSMMEINKKNLPEPLFDAFLTIKVTRQKETLIYLNTILSC